MGKPSQHIVYQENYQKEALSYLNYQTTLGYSANTCQTRYLFLKEFFAFLESLGIYQLQHITTVEILAFQEYLSHKRNPKNGERIKKNSVYSHMRELQMYLGYVQELGRIKINPASHLKFNTVNDKSERIVFTQTQIKELLQATKTLQERAMLLIAYGCGLRVAELVDLKQEDIRLSENILIVQKGKNNKRRLIPITDKLKEEIQSFLERENKHENEYKTLFINTKNTPLQEPTANKTLKNVLKRTAFGRRFSHAQLVQIGIHTLRHSIATHLLENGMKLEQVQTFLGHSHIESTEIYTHVSQNQLNEIIR
jgi:integrase/recombinase XerD